jgi:hypothetical protein
MRRLVIVPMCGAAVIVGVLGAGVAGAGGQAAPGWDVAKTTIPTAPTGPAPTGPVPTAPVPTAPVPTIPVPTAPQPTVAVPTAPVPTAPVPTAPVPTVPVPTVGVPTTEASGLSPESLAVALPIFGLDPTKLQCIDAALPSFSSDDNAAFAGLQRCGVAVMPLLRGIVAVVQASNGYLDPTATTVALPPVPGVESLPMDDTFFLGFMMLIDTTQASCLATGLAGATADDDATALAIFQRCEVSLAFTLDMLTFGLVGDFAVDPTATTVPAGTTPLPTVPVASGVPTTLSVAPDDPIVDEFQAALLEEQGITLDDAQAACLLSHIGTEGDIDTEDTAALFELLDSCGITLTDLLPSNAENVSGQVQLTANVTP